VCAGAVRPGSTSARAAVGSGPSTSGRRWRISRRTRLASPVAITNLTERRQRKLTRIQQINEPLYRGNLVAQQLSEIYRVPIEHALMLLDGWLKWRDDRDCPRSSISRRRSPLGALVDLPGPEQFLADPLGLPRRGSCQRRSRRLGLGKSRCRRDQQIWRRASGMWLYAHQRSEVTIAVLAPSSAGAVLVTIDGDPVRTAILLPVNAPRVRQLSFSRQPVSAMWSLPARWSARTSSWSGGSSASAVLIRI
jgi:hypothetical protein